MATISIARQLLLYPDLDPTRQREIQNNIFGELIDIEDELARQLARATSIYTGRFAPLETFITTIQTDTDPNTLSFTADQVRDAIAARLSLRQRFATAANSIPGVSGAVAVSA